MKLWICLALFLATLIGAGVLTLLGGAPSARADDCGGYECSAAS